MATVVHDLCLCIYFYDMAACFSPFEECGVKVNALCTGVRVNENKTEVKTTFSLSSEIATSTDDIVTIESAEHNRDFLLNFILSGNRYCEQSFVQQCSEADNQTALAKSGENSPECTCIRLVLNSKNNRNSFMPCSDSTVMHSLSSQELEENWLYEFNQDLEPLQRGLLPVMSVRKKMDSTPDEHISNTLLINDLICTEAIVVGDEFACTSGHLVDMSAECHLDFDRTGEIIGCKDLTHLQSCGLHNCRPGFVKCQDSYCLAVRFVCDGTADCPHKEDEMLCGERNHTCDSYYRCSESNTCLPEYQVCDGEQHCPFGDDELFCNLPCPVGCTCAQYEMECRNLTDTGYFVKEKLDVLRYLDLSGSQLGNLPNLKLPLLFLLNISHGEVASIEPFSFSHLVNLVTLDLSRNQLQELQENTFSGLSRLQVLQLDGNNQLKVIVPGSFEGLSNVTELRISFTGLTELKSGTFRGLISLKRLDVSQNQIVTISNGAFSKLSMLISLSMQKNSVKHFDKDIYKPLVNLENLQTDAYRFCCIKPEKVNDSYCVPSKDKFSSCSDLMTSDGPRYLLRIIAVLSLILNAYSLVYRCIYDRARFKLGFGIFLTSLNIVDFLMGVYLSIIAIADMIYLDTYIVFKEIWTQSSICTLAGILCTLSCECSVFFTILISIDRLLVVKYPLGEYKLTSKSALIVSGVAWSVGIVLSVIPLIFKGYFQGRFYSSRSVCVALPLTSDKPPGWEYSFSIFVIFNFLCFMLVASAQLYIRRAVKQSESSARSTKRSDVKLSGRLLLIVASDFVSWFPIGILGLLAWTENVNSADVYVWIIALVLPINSVINPVIYTLSTSRMGTKKDKMMEVQRTETSAHNKTKKSEMSITMGVKKLEKALIGTGPIRFHNAKLLCMKRSLEDHMKLKPLRPKEAFRVTWDVVCRIKRLHKTGLLVQKLDDQTIFLLANREVILCTVPNFSVIPRKQKDDMKEDIGNLVPLVRKLLISTTKKDAGVE